MDALGAAASIIAVVELSAKVASVCVEYSRAVKNAPKDIDRLLNELKSLQDVLEKVKEVLDGQNGSKLLASQPLRIGLDSCGEELKTLEQKLEPSTSRRRIRRVGLRALKWPFETEEVNKVLGRLERCKQSISLALQLDQTALTLAVNQKIDLAKLPSAEGAAFDSYVDELDARCHPDTRVELRQRVRQWADDRQGKGIFWLCGIAGTGKSTISRTVAQSFADEGLLAASFFFKRGEEDRGNAKRFFSTIASQMAVKIPILSSFISAAIEADPTLTSKSTKEQFEKLILQPLSEASIPQHMSRLVMVIDALDECEREGDIKNILHLLTRFQDIASVSVRVFVTSRPELPVRLGFKEVSETAYQNLILHGIPRNIIEHDITAVLKDEFKKIQKNYDSRNPNSPLPSDWPGEKAIHILVEMAIPLFIFAATVSRFVGDIRWDPQKRLQAVLTYQTASQASKLDRTYFPILNGLLNGLSDLDKDTLIGEFQVVVGSIVLLINPLSTVSLANLLDIPESTVNCRLDSLHSVLSVPTDRSVPVRLLHLSFREFLTDPEKRDKYPFWVDPRRAHEIIATKCVELMRHSLKENICELEYPGTLRTEIDNQIIDARLPAHVQYACCNWVHHLEQSAICIYDDCPVHLLLLEHFLHWLEALALIGRLAESIEQISLLKTLLDPENSLHLENFLVDAGRFVLKGRSVIDLAPLQIYSSAIIFTPEKSLIRNLFKRKCPSWIRRWPKVESTWSAQLQTLEGHTGSVYAVAFSPDGKLLASAAGDGTVRLWDPATGSTVQTLEGHIGSVHAVAFSPDGKLLASAAGDRTVRLWDPATGSTVQTLEGHIGSVHAVAFSPDGKLLASAARDGTVRLWDPATGSTVQTLEGHIGWVRAVAFSPDGKLLASAAGDGTVRLWDPATGSTVQTLEGHIGSVRAVAFSPDGKLLASAADDGTVRLWDPATGSTVQTLEGYIGSVHAVAFSPDGKLLASAARDGTVRLWDPATGSTVQTLEGHTHLVHAVAFSPDGKLLASAAGDRTVRLWDPATGSTVQTLEGNTSSVRAVAFSPDGKLLASAADDGTVRLWDPATGSTVQTLEGHIGSVHAVAFSPDGKLLASAASDRTVRLWDPATGSTVQTLEGHTHLVHAVAFSPDGKLLASAAGDRTVRLWDPATGSTVQTLEGHIGLVCAVAFSPDGKLLASAAGDRTVRLWDPATGSTVQTLKVDAVVQTLSFSVDGTCLKTDRGLLDATTPFLSPGTVLSRPALSRGVFVKEKWIVRGKENLLWLPSDYRSTSAALRESVIVLGHASGRISFLEFALS